MTRPALAPVSAAAFLVDLAGLLESGEVDGVGVDFLSWGFYAPEYWRNHLHTHSFVEVCLAYAGRGVFTSRAQDHPVGAGDLFIARPGDVHEIVSSREDPLGIAFWGFALRSRPLAGAPCAAPEEPAAPPPWVRGLLAADAPAVSRDLGILPAVVEALAQEAAAPRSGYRARLAALGELLVLETARACSTAEDLQVTAVRTDRTKPAVATMERYMADNLERRIGVVQIAEAAHLSSRHAARIFAAERGVSIMGRLRTLRLERAARLLLETEEPVAQIARACGYAEVRGFITAFRREHGQPPGAFRACGGTLHLPR
ncbi:AraC family transcriptional regulator [Brachybacterium hainanense]|uniref:AraC family transcriptional regulator n=1 Tax=Brachybacterium hainanense TaxID=1541174 RepID=A0ABV6RD53_9MICO